MKQSALLMMLLSMSGIALAQSDTTRPAKPDTIRIGNMVIVKKGEVHVQVEKRWHEQRTSRRKQSKDNTNWLIFDLGVSQFQDKTLYPVLLSSNPAIRVAQGATQEWFDLKNNKSINVNIWFFMQNISLVRQAVNLKYGLGLELNNYRFANPIRFSNSPTRVNYIYSYQYTISKNKLAADYLTVPLMINFNFNPKDKKQHLGLSAGISAGYLYSSRQKLITSSEGKEKIRDDFGLRPFKLSYIAELRLGPVSLYGSLATQSMFRNGLNQIPYNVGFRFSYW